MPFIFLAGIKHSLFLRIENKTIQRKDVEVYEKKRKIEENIKGKRQEVERQIDIDKDR